MTYDKARQALFTILRGRGWTLKLDLKTPCATSPSGNFRLWFKPQAVHYTEGNRHEAGNARSLSYNLDIRKEDPAKLVDWIGRNFKV